MNLRADTRYNDDRQLTLEDLNIPTYTGSQVVKASYIDRYWELKNVIMEGEPFIQYGADNNPPADLDGLPEDAYNPIARQQRQQAQIAQSKKAMKEQINAYLKELTSSRLFNDSRTRESYVFKKFKDFDQNVFKYYALDF